MAKVRLNVVFNFVDQVQIEATPEEMEAYKEGEFPQRWVDAITRMDKKLTENFRNRGQEIEYQDSWADFDEAW